MIKKKLITIKIEARNFYITWALINITNNLLLSVPTVWVLYILNFLSEGNIYDSVRSMFLLFIPCGINFFIGFKRYIIPEEYYERTKDEFQINLISLLKFVITIILYYTLSLNNTGNDNTFLTYMCIATAGIVGGFLNYNNITTLIISKYKTRCCNVSYIFKDSEWTDYFEIKENQDFLFNHLNNRRALITILQVCEKQQDIDLLKEVIKQSKVKNLNKLNSLVLIKGLSRIYDTIKFLDIFNLDEEDRNSSVINWLKKEYEIGYKKEAIHVWKDLKENKRYTLEKSKPKKENIDPIMLLIDMGAEDDKPKTKKVSKI